MNSYDTETSSLAISSRPNANKPMGTAPTVDVLYLAGVSYCGSTLMSFLLNGHPEIFSVGEMGPASAIEHEGYKCSCGAELVKCPFNLGVKGLMEAKYGVPFDLGHWDLRHDHSIPYFRNLLMVGPLASPLFNTMRDVFRSLIPGHGRRIHTYACRNEAFMRAALEVSAKRVFLDTTKSFIRIPFLQNISGLNLKVLHLVRDPRAHAYSSRRHAGMTCKNASIRWVKANKAIEIYIGRLESDQAIRLRYEDLCREPEDSLSRLTDFIGIEPFVLTRGFRDVPHHIIGNKMRLSSDHRETVELDEKWREKLQDEDLQTVSRIAGPLARKYKYDI